MRGKAFIENIMRAVLLSAIWAVVALAAGESRAETRVALVIGNSNYEHVSSLRNPANDAGDMAGTLEELGFEVEKVLNADFTTLRRALYEFGDRADGADVALIFYAGHGIEVDDQNYLIPVDARLRRDRDVDFEAVSLDLALTAVEPARSLRLIILDACRDNPFVATMERSGAGRSVGRGLARVEPQASTLVAFAAAEGSIADDGDDRNSPYTSALLEHMATPGVEIGLMFRRVRDSVVNETRNQQQPFVYGSLSGEPFYLSIAPEPGPGTTTPATSGNQPGTSTPDSGGSSDLASERQLDFELWRTVQGASDPALIQAYLDQFPNGIFAAVARRMLEQLENGAITQVTNDETQVAAIAPDQDMPAADAPAVTPPAASPTPMPAVPPNPAVTPPTSGPVTGDPAQARVVFQFGHTATVDAVAVSPDGRFAASGSEDGSLKIWDLASSRLVQSLVGHDGGTRAVTFDPSGRTIISGGGDYYVRVWDVQTGQVLQQLGQTEGSVEDVAVSPDGRYAASGGSDFNLTLWDLQTGQKAYTFTGHTDWIRGISFSPDGARIATASDDGSVRIWDIASGRELRALNGHDNWVMAVAYSPDGRTLLSGSSDQTMRLWDANTGEQMRIFTDYTDWVRTVQFSPDGRYAVSGDDNNYVRVYDANSGANIHTFAGHENWIYSIAVSPDGQRIVSGAMDRSVRVWNMATGQQQAVFEGHSGAATAVTFTPDGNTIVSGGTDGTIRLWNAVTGALVDTWRGGAEQIDYITFHPDGDRFFTGGGYTLQLWSMRARAPVESYSGMEGSVLAIDVSDDGRFVAVGGSDNLARVWDIDSGKMILALAHHTDYVRDVAFSPDGKYLVSASDDKLLVRWDLNFGKVVRVYEHHTDWIRSVVVLEGGQFMISAGDDGNLVFWEIETGTVIDSATGMTGWPLRLYVSPDGRRLLSGANDNTMMMWDIGTGQQLLTYTAGAGLASFAMSPDGLAIASAGSSGVTLWRTDRPTQVARLIAAGERDYLIELPDGRWTGSQGAVDRYVALFEGFSILDIPATRHPSYYGAVDSLQLGLGPDVAPGSDIPRDPDAAYRYAFWLLLGPSENRDPYRAVAALRVAADGGDARAMHELGMLLSGGKFGVATDQYLAADFVLRAVRARDPFAMLDVERANDRLSQQLREAIQIQLQQAGYYNGTIDGVFGPGTLSAVTAFTGG